MLPLNLLSDQTKMIEVTFREIDSLLLALLWGRVNGLNLFFSPSGQLPHAEPVVVGRCPRRSRLSPRAESHGTGRPRLIEVHLRAGSHVLVLGDVSASGSLGGLTHLRQAGQHGGRHLVREAPDENAAITCNGTVKKIRAAIKPIAGIKR